MLTDQRLHAIIREATGSLSSNHSPAEKISRSSYSLYNGFKHCIGISAVSQDIYKQIIDVLQESSINFVVTYLGEDIHYIKVDR